MPGGIALGMSWSPAGVKDDTLPASHQTSTTGEAPLRAHGKGMRCRWHNSKQMKQWSHQHLDVTDVVNNTARVDVKHLSGPIRVAGGHTFSMRLSWAGKGLVKLAFHHRDGSASTVERIR